MESSQEEHHQIDSNDRISLLIEGSALRSMLNAADASLDAFVRYVPLQELNKRDTEELIHLLDSLEVIVGKLLEGPPVTSERQSPTPNDLQPVQRVCALKERLKYELPPKLEWLDKQHSDTGSSLYEQLKRLTAFCMAQLAIRLPHTWLIMCFDILICFILVLCEYYAAVFYLLRGFCAAAVLTLFIMYIPTLARFAYILASVNQVKWLTLCAAEVVYTLIPIRPVRHALPLIQQNLKLKSSLAVATTNAAEAQRREVDNLTSLVEKTVIVLDLDEQLKNINFVELHLRSAPQFILQAYFTLVILNSPIPYTAYPSNNFIITDSNIAVPILCTATALNLVLQSWASSRTAHVFRTDQTMPDICRTLLIFLVCLIFEGLRASIFVVILYSKPLYAIIIATTFRISLVCLAAVINAMREDNSFKRVNIIDLLMEAWSLGVAVGLAGVSSWRDFIRIVCMAIADVILQCVVYFGFN